MYAAGRSVSLTSKILCDGKLRWLNKKGSPLPVVTHLMDKNDLSGIFTALHQLEDNYQRFCMICSFRS